MGLVNPKAVVNHESWYNKWHGGGRSIGVSLSVRVRHISEEGKDASLLAILIRTGGCRKTGGFFAYLS